MENILKTVLITVAVAYKTLSIVFPITANNLFAIKDKRCSKILAIVLMKALHVHCIRFSLNKTYKNKTI